MERNKVNRKAIFDRFQNHDTDVTEEEIRYLANTSSILNSVVDKDFYQKAVNLFDKETLENVTFTLFLVIFRLDGNEHH